MGKWIRLIRSLNQDHVALVITTIATISGFEDLIKSIKKVNVQKKK